MYSVGVPALIGSPLSANSSITVIVEHINHNPILILTPNHTQSIQYNTVYVDKVNVTTEYEFSFYGYDRDKEDRIMFR